MTKYKVKILICQIMLLILFIVFWEISARTGLINSFIFSYPSKIISTIINLIKENNLFTHLFTTLYEIIISFSLGLIIAFLLSTIMYTFRFIGDIFEPYLTAINSLPKVALGPLIIIWVGANMKSIILMAVLTNAIIATITIYTGFINTNSIALSLFKTYKASKFQILTKLVIPANLGTMFSATKITISLTLIGVIMGEFLVSKAGIGYLIIYGTQVFNLSLVMSGIVILIIISFILYKLVVTMEKIILHL